MKKSQISFEFVTILFALIVIFSFATILFGNYFLENTKNDRENEIDSFVNRLNNEILFMQSASEGYKNEIVIEDLIKNVEVVSLTGNNLLLHDKVSKQNYTFTLEKNYFPKLEKRKVKGKDKTVLTFYKTENTRDQLFIDTTVPDFAGGDGCWVGTDLATQRRQVTIGLSADDARLQTHPLAVATDRVVAPGVAFEHDQHRIGNRLPGQTGTGGAESQRRLVSVC